MLNNIYFPKKFTNADLDRNPDNMGVAEKLCWLSLVHGYNKKHPTIKACEIFAKNYRLYTQDAIQENEEILKHLQRGNKC